jgi:hypothetical protein
MSNQTVKSQIIGGLRITASVLVVIFTGMGLIGGVAMLRIPGGPHPDSLVARHPLIPWMCIAAATAILIVTIDRWARILPSILAYGAVGGLIMLATGRYNSIYVPRLSALILTFFMVLTGALTLSIGGRPLNLLDRIALLAFVFCIAFSVTPDISAMTKALAIGLSFLLLAWTVKRVRPPRGPSSSQRLGVPPEGGESSH